MEVTFIEKHTYSADINFNTLKQYIKNDIEKVMPADGVVTNELIYLAFRKNPEYYLTKLGYLSTLSSVSDNLATIKNISDKFFIFCMKDIKTCYYVLKGGEMLAKYEDDEMAKFYAHRMNGYVIKV